MVDAFKRNADPKGIPSGNNKCKDRGKVAQLTINNLSRTVRHQFGSPQQEYDCKNEWHVQTNINRVSNQFQAQINLKSNIHLWSQSLNNFTLYNIPLFLLEITLSRGEIATDYHNNSHAAKFDCCITMSLEV